MLRVQRMGYEAAGGRLIGRRIFVVVVAACGTETGSEVKHACAELCMHAPHSLGKAVEREKGKAFACLLAVGATSS